MSCRLFRFFAQLVGFLKTRNMKTVASPDDPKNITKVWNDPKRPKTRTSQMVCYDLSRPYTVHLFGLIVTRDWPPSKAKTFEWGLTGQGVQPTHLGGMGHLEENQRQPPQTPWPTSSKESAWARAAGYEISKSFWNTHDSNPNIGKTANRKCIHLKKS